MSSKWHNQLKFTWMAAESGSDTSELLAGAHCLRHQVNSNGIEQVFAQFSIPQLRSWPLRMVSRDLTCAASQIWIPSSTLPVKRRQPTSSPLESLLLLTSRPNRGRVKEEAPEIPRPPLLPATPRAGADRERRISDGRWWGAGPDPSVSLAHSGLLHTKMGSDTHKATGGTNGGKRDWALKTKGRRHQVW